MNNKKIIFLLIGILYFNLSSAQDMTDALRYSFLNPGGSARLQAIGGAGVSLGGDPSMVNTNPAAIGMFKSSDLSFTGNLKIANMKGEYLGQTASENRLHFAIPQIELIIAGQNRNRNSKWKNFSFGIGVNRLADFNKTIFYKGNNGNSSFSDQYLNLVNGGIDGSIFTDADNDVNYLADNYHQGVIQAYDSYLIDPPSGNNDVWTSLPGGVLAQGKSLHQTNIITTDGGINEFSLAFAANYNNKLFMGGGLFIPSINFDRKKTFKETPKGGDPLLDSYSVENRLHTDGVGVAGKLGAIYLINSQWRVGASVHTSTYYNMHDSYTTTITTSSKDMGVKTSTTADYTNGYPDEYDYSLSTPWRFMGGVSYLFKGMGDAISGGFLTLDYEYVNYGASKFHFNGDNSTAADKEYANQLNKNIKESYKGGSNIRLGGELKFNLLSVRAGFSYMGSPYEESDLIGSQLKYSLGLGYRKNNFYADLTYTLTDKGEHYDQPYTLNPDYFPGGNSPKPALVYGNLSKIYLTIGFRL